MDENIKNVTETAAEAVETIVDDTTMDAAKDAIAETVKAAAQTSPWAIFLLVIAGIGLIATGGWVIFAIIWLVKFIKKKVAAAQKAANTVVDDFDDDVFSDDISDEEVTEE